MTDTHCSITRRRIYRPQRASWVRLGKIFAAPLDLSRHQGMGVWIHGDGRGELMNFQLGTQQPFEAHADHYVIVDFTGWRYFELVEPESERFEDYSWPYGRCIYSQYRDALGFGRVEWLNLWYNNVPVGQEVRCLPQPRQGPAAGQGQDLTARDHGRRPDDRLPRGDRERLLPRVQRPGRLPAVRPEARADPASSKPEGEVPVLEAGDNE